MSGRTTCSACGGQGHNVRTCSAPSAWRERGGPPPAGGKGDQVSLDGELELAARCVLTEAPRVLTALQVAPRASPLVAKAPELSEPVYAHEVALQVAGERLVVVADTRAHLDASLAHLRGGG